jgi:nucleoside-diphosphate-sugar epimerase
METVLVAGGCGYVGSEAVRQLVALGKKVAALDCSPPEQDVECIEADLTDAAGLMTALQGRSFDCIMHFASLPGDTGNPTQMVRVNVDGCQNLLECARQLKVARVVVASSISAYEWYPATKFNPPDYMPVDEEHPCRPKDMYSTTKRVQELLALTYYHQFGLGVTVLRLTAVVGPQGRGGGRGWGEFARQLAEGKAVQVPHFSAEELCHYVDRRDVARMFVAAAEHPAAVGQIFNCCGPAPTRGSEFITILQRLSPGIRVDFGYPWSMAQGGEIAFSMAKAERLLGFTPMYTIGDSLRSIKDWIDNGGLTEEKSSRTGSYTAGIGAAKET